MQADIHQYSTMTIIRIWKENTGYTILSAYSKYITDRVGQTERRQILDHVWMLLYRVFV